MRFFIIIALIFFTNAYSATAQNFQPFKNKYKYQFSYTGYLDGRVETDLIHGMQVDSAKLIGSDSIFYFNNRSYDNPFKDNFWGNSMVKKQNGEYLFLITNNTQNDTLIVKTQETLGSQWTFNLQALSYTIQYKSYKQETVLTNQMDFVKTYVVENTSGFKDSIKISENFGLIYSFPFSDDLYTPHSSLALTYIFNSKIGENKINYFEYFNYELGDMLEYTPDYRVPAGYPDRTGDDIYKVISKTISLNADTIKYLFSICHLDDIDVNKNYIATQSHCELVVTDCSVSGNFPYIELLSFPFTNTTHFTFAPTVNGFIISRPLIFEYDPSYSYQIGLGLKEYIRGGGFDYDYIFYTNIRYIKQTNLDDDCTGLQTILDTKSLHALSGNLVVAPNPFDQSISINASNLNPGTWNIRIVSALGVEVYISPIVISSSNQQIDLSNLSILTAGIYFLSIENESQVYSQKIVKK